MSDFSPVPTLPLHRVLRLASCDRSSGTQSGTLAWRHRRPAGTAGSSRGAVSWPRKGLLRAYSLWTAAQPERECHFIGITLKKRTHTGLKSTQSVQEPGFLRTFRLRREWVHDCPTPLTVRCNVPCKPYIPDIIA